MRIDQEKVRLFHEKIEYPTADTPRLVSRGLANDRYLFILEEANEYAKANDDGSVVEVADAIADLLYVVLGTAVVHGIDLEPVFEEVHRSNMTKTADAVNDQSVKRCIKGPGFEKPRIAEILLKQTLKLEETPL